MKWVHSLKNQHISWKFMVGFHFNVLFKKNGPFSGFFRGQKVFFNPIFSHCLVSGGFGNPPEAQAPQNPIRAEWPSQPEELPALAPSFWRIPSQHWQVASFTKHFVFRYLKWRNPHQTLAVMDTAGLCKGKKCPPKRKMALQGSVPPF